MATIQSTIDIGCRFCWHQAQIMPSGLSFIPSLSYLECVALVSVSIYSKMVAGALDFISSQLHNWLNQILSPRLRERLTGLPCIWRVTYLFPNQSLWPGGCEALICLAEVIWSWYQLFWDPMDWELGRNGSPKKNQGNYLKKGNWILGSKLRNKTIQRKNPQLLNTLVFLIRCLNKPFIYVKEESYSV